MSAETIPTGTYIVEAHCPRCNAIEEVLVSIRSVLTTPEDDPATLRVRLKCKARDHDCNQSRLVINTATGELSKP
jgi:hypothetical protein